MRHLSREEEAPNIIKGLTPGELKDGLQIMSWEDGHIKYKVMPDHIQWTTIYVEPDARERRVGTDIMRWLEQEARDLGKKYLLVQAFTDGKSDILGRFLTKLKYRHTEAFWWKKEL